MYFGDAAKCGQGRFTHGNPQPGPACSVDTSYTALCMQEQDAARLIGAGHTRMACLQIFGFLIFFHVFVFLLYLILD